MGVCSSTDGAGLSPAEKAALKQEQDRNKQVEKEVKDAETLEQRVNKLLLLGAGSSGKSTLFKQMITIYGKGFGESERKSYTNIIYNNVLTAMRTLCLHSSKYGVVDERLSDSKKILEAEMKEDQPVTEELGAHIQALWADPAILTTYEHQAEFQLTDSAKYFFDKIDEVSKFGYVPTEQDVLRCRAPTTGIVENTFEIEGNTFKMFDVGGQRNERKKWIHCFENVTAVLFVAAISEYNQVLYEDETQNRMVESLTLFDEICNSKWFRKTSMILMLNKRDLFAEKIVKWPLSDYFRDYDGDNSYDACVEWIQARFEEKNQEHDKQIYTHITCATDTNNIKIVFAAVKDTIIRKNLTRVGLL